MYSELIEGSCPLLVGCKNEDIKLGGAKCDNDDAGHLFFDNSSESESKEDTSKKSKDGSSGEGEDDASGKGEDVNSGKGENNNGGQVEDNASRDGEKLNVKLRLRDGNKISN